MAVALYQISHRRWFPVPLVFLHGVLALYNLYAAFIGPNNYWVVFALNRLFEFEVLYIVSCSLFRIAAMKRRAPVRLRK